MFMFIECQLHELFSIYRTNRSNNWDRAFDMFEIVIKWYGIYLSYTLPSMHKTRYNVCIHTTLEL